MSRIEWSRLSGDEVESVISVLVCREYPDSTRVKPSQGDGGIDVNTPIAGGGVEVRQIKGYAGNLTATRKRHIKESWETLRAYAEAERLNVARWYLITLENPTTQQLAWLDELTKDASFPRLWLGLDHVDGLAAKYPDVIDYYLGNGKERLQEVVGRFLQLAGRSDISVAPAALQESLQEIHKALNQFDPHYSYDFAVESLLPDGSFPAPTPVPANARLVAVLQMSDGVRCTTFKIRARFAEATVERPVLGRMVLEVDRGSALEAEIEDWFKFGAPLRNVPAKELSVDLPGGFERKGANAFVTLGPAAQVSGPTPDVTISIHGANGAIIDSLDFRPEESSAGWQGLGTRAAGHDTRSGALRYELRMHTGDGLASINLKVEDLAGRHPGDLLASLRFAAAVQPGRTLQLAVRHGPSLGGAWTVEDSLVSEESAATWIRVCEDLMVIQQHVVAVITVPDMSMCNLNDLAAWHAAAVLLQGETVTTEWSEQLIHLSPGSQAPAAPVNGAQDRELTIDVGGNQHVLGMVTEHFATVRLDPGRSPVQHGDHFDVWLVPDGDPTATVHMRPATDAA